MNLNRIIRLKLLLLFALLQCVAPVAHAHVDGNNASQNAHVAAAHSLRLAAHGHDHQDYGTARLADDEQHKAVISMPPEYRSSALTLFAQPVVASQPGIAVPAWHGVLAFDGFYQSNLTLFPYRLPLSQAPPV